ncbi:MAG: BadF/BadG/BcrA/BcrD ATPase family protein [bacterium]
MSTNHVLAVDGGNSKTLAAVMSDKGELLSLVRESGSNYQGIGRRNASKVLSRAIGSSLDKAEVKTVHAACYGIAGADRDKDFEVIREILKPLNPAPDMILVNDTQLALRAGTKDGTGVALIGGAGSNCIGQGRDGSIKKAWGLGPLTGDKANASALVHDAIVAAMKGRDGRASPTALEGLFKDALGLDAIEDVIEADFADAPLEADFTGLAPLVFQAAKEGDPAAVSVLDSHGRAAAEAALAVMRGLFSPAEEVPLVLGGSVLQKGESPVLINTVKELVTEEFPKVRFQVLSDHPLLGGVLLALDRLLGRTPAEVEDKARKDIARHVSLLESEL